MALTERLTANATVATIFSTEAADYMVDPDRCLAHLSRRRGARGHDIYYDGRFEWQAPLDVDARIGST